MNYWLMKSEPSTFSVDDLAAGRAKTTAWDGIRNYQARNMLRDEFERGDLALFYHSSCAEPGVVGVMEVVKAGYPDVSQFDEKSEHYDPGSHLNDPRWYCVDVKLKHRMPRVITLEEMRSHTQLSALKLLQRSNRLSVMPVTRAEWEFILALE